VSAEGKRKERKRKEKEKRKEKRGQASISMGRLELMSRPNKKVAVDRGRHAVSPVSTPNKRPRQLNLSFGNTN